MNHCTRELFERFIAAGPEAKADLLPRMRQCAREGNHNFSGLLAWYYLNRRPRDGRSLALAEKWALRAIGDGGSGAHYHLAWARWHRDSSDPRIRPGLRAAIRAGDVELVTVAMSDLGTAWREGAGGASSLRWARHWYRKAAATGDPIAKRMLRRKEFRERATDAAGRRTGNLRQAAGCGTLE